MREPLLDPFQQRIVICALAVLLLGVSVLGLWLCRRLRRAYARLYARQIQETDVVLAHPEYRQARVPKQVDLREDPARSRDRVD